MEDDERSATRRSTLERVGVAAVGGAVGMAATTGTVGAGSGGGAAETTPRVTGTTATTLTLAWPDDGTDRYVTYWLNTETRHADYEFVTGTHNTIDGLDPATTYAVWLRTDDGWHGPVSTTTAAAAATAAAEEEDADRPFARRVERRVHETVNERRGDAGLESLAWRADVAGVAREHSEYQVEVGRLTHSGPDGGDTGERLAAAGVRCRAWAENVCYNYGGDATAAEAAARLVGQWLDSPGHRANLLGDYAVTGVGVARTDGGALYATQVVAAGCD